MRYGGKVNGGAGVDPVHVGTLLPQMPPRKLFQVSDWSNGSVASELPLGLTQNHNAAVVAPPSGMVLFNQTGSLVENGTTGVNPDARLGANQADPNKYAPTATTTDDKPPSDLRQHPWYRLEWLQKLTNLSTVRTHQYAVWVTVGYFEVTQEGNPQLAATNPAAAYDLLGPELVDATGKTTRNQAFFVLDRTKATGYNPSDPGDFREVVVYRRRIK